MRVLLLTHHYEPEIGAPQRRWSALTREWQAAGHEVVVIAPLPHYPAAASTADLRVGMRAWRTHRGRHGETVVRVPFLPHGYGALGRSLDHAAVALASVWAGSVRRLMGHPTADVVIATVPALPTLLAGRILSIAHRAPLIVEMRDAWPDLVTYTPGLKAARGVRQLVSRAVERAVTHWQRSADTVVTTSARFAGIIAQRGVRSVLVIRNGAHLGDTPNLGGARPPRGELRVLYAGTLGRSQGLETALDALDRVAAGGIRVRMRLIGDGARRQFLMTRAERCKNPVEFLGTLSREEVLEHYRWADTVLVSLRAWKPLEWTVPSKLYEVMATSKHVSAMVAGEAAEVAVAGSAGFVVDPGDADALARQWMQLAEMGVPRKDGRAWVAGHAEYGALAQKYLETLSAALRRGHKKSSGWRSAVRGKSGVGRHRRS